MIHPNANSSTMDGDASARVVASSMEVGRQQAAVTNGMALIGPRFSATKNPYLSPANLLDPWADTSTQDDHYLCGNDSYEGGVAASDQAAENFEVQVSGNSAGAAADESRWWLVHTKPRQEKKLAEGLQCHQVPHFLPVTKCQAITRGRTRTTQQPLFAGYLFLWANHQQRHTALETNRIVATYPVGCQENLGQHLWNLADLIEKGVPLRVEERLAAGRTVRVKAGLLKGKCGKIIKRGGKTRLFVFVKEMLGGVSVEIEQHLLEPY